MDEKAVKDEGAEGRHEWRNGRHGRCLHDVTDPRVAYTRLYYRKLGLHRGWPAKRFIALCRALNRPPELLAAFFCIPRGMLNVWLKRGLLPPTVSLHFLILEQALKRGPDPLPWRTLLYDSPHDPPVDNVNSQQHTPTS